MRSKKIDDDIMVACADTVFYPDAVNVWGILQYFLKKQSDLVACYHPADGEDVSARALVSVDTDDQHVTMFPGGAAPTSPGTADRVGAARLCPALYCFRRATLGRVHEYLDATPAGTERRTLEYFTHWLTEAPGAESSAPAPVSGMRVPTHFKLMDRSEGLESYRQVVEEFRERSRPLSAGSDAARGAASFTHRTHSRVGLMGNPSDGFGGKTIALLCTNFWAECTVTASTQLRLIPHPLNDPNTFGSLGDLYGVSRHEGYQGGLRLMQATCKRFFEYCTEHGLGIGRGNFSMQYDTNIPRQVGLAGSSAIVLSCLKALMSFYGLGYADIPKHALPSLVLSVENELGINAGLQDRVVQVYEGLVYMDLSTELLKLRGFGAYENIALPLEELPQLFLVYLSDPSDSGKIHNDVKMRWLNGEQQVVDAMEQFAEYTEQAKEAILARDWDRLADLMDANFALRRKTYGERAIAPEMLKMVAIAQRHGAAAKFPGSGGAVVGMCRGDNGTRNLAALRKEYEEEGYVFCLLTPKEPVEDGPRCTPPRPGEGPGARSPLSQSPRSPPVRVRSCAPVACSAHRSHAWPVHADRRRAPLPDRRPHARRALLG